MAVQATVPVRDQDDLSLAYTPGVARVCTAIAENPELVHDYTWKSQVVAVVTDGTAVLGLGDIGPEASLPVMEGKAILFKQFGGVDAVPIALATTDADEIVETVVRLAPSFGGVNLEDISAPRCFEIERQLQERLDIPVFHDDQHGTAVVTLAALRNAAKLTGREHRRPARGHLGRRRGRGRHRQVPAGGGHRRRRRHGPQGRRQHADRDDLTDVKRELAELTNKAGLSGSLESALAGADVFIGVSGGTVPEAAVASMAQGAFVFAMANPNPEVHPDVAHQYAAVVATGRVGLPEPDQQRAGLPRHLRRRAPGAGVPDHRGHEDRGRRGAGRRRRRRAGADYVIPSPFDERVAPAVTAAVAAAARAEGVARR